MESNKTTIPDKTQGNSLELFAVFPKSDCPHQSDIKFDQALDYLTKEALLRSCTDCGGVNENWMCLTCGAVSCSRFCNSHMLKHNETTSHPVALSFTDGSYWCYSCDSYVTSDDLNFLSAEFSKLKTPSEKVARKKSSTIILNPTKDTIQIQDIKEPEEESHNFSRQALIKGLKNKEYKRVVLLTGAGISTSAGIPDFRSDVGIYSQLGECNLPYPEAIFEIGYFKEHPETFCKLAKVLMGYKPKPTVAHYFIKMLADEGVLLMNFTQNVDGLEIESGVDSKYLMEAHGHTRTAHCASCRKEGDVELLRKELEAGNVLRCECKGPIKPDIIFFGEALPASFYLNTAKIAQGDLVIVMGTSLKVFPFASLVSMIPEEVPVVLINRENTTINRERFLFMEGEIDGLVEGLVKELGWEGRLGELKKNEKK